MATQRKIHCESDEEIYFGIDITYLDSNAPIDS